MATARLLCYFCMKEQLLWHPSAGCFICFNCFARMAPWSPSEVLTEPDRPDRINHNDGSPSSMSHSSSASAESAVQSPESSNCAGCGATMTLCNTCSPPHVAESTMQLQNSVAAASISSFATAAISSSNSQSSSEARCADQTTIEISMRAAEHTSMLSSIVEHACPVWEHSSFFVPDQVRASTGHMYSSDDDLLPPYWPEYVHLEATTSDVSVEYAVSASRDTSRFKQNNR